MNQKAAKGPPPYATFPAFVSFLNKLKETVVPPKIDRTLFGNTSGSLIYSIMGSLKALDLIDEAGIPQPPFKELVQAGDDERKPIFITILKRSYPELWGGDLDLATMTAGQFDDLLRVEYQITGSTIDKAAAFFIAAANYAGIELSPHLKNRRAIATSTASQKSAKQRKKAEDAVVDPPPPPPPLLPSNGSSDKPLEYQLIDLMQAPDIPPEVKKSIWELVQYLMARKAGAAG